MGRGTEADGGSPITGYYIQYDESPTFDAQGDEIYVAVPASTPAGNGYSHDISALDPAKTYYIRVRAVNSEGSSGFCDSETDSTTARCTGAALSGSPAV